MCDCWESTGDILQRQNPMDNTAHDTIDKAPEPITLDAIERAKALGRGEVLPERKESTEGDPNKLLDFYLDD